MSQLDEEYDPDMDKEYDPASPVPGSTYLPESPKPKHHFSGSTYLPESPKPKHHLSGSTYLPESPKPKRQRSYSLMDCTEAKIKDYSKSNIPGISPRKPSVSTYTIPKATGSKSSKPSEMKFSPCSATSTPLKARSSKEEDDLISSPTSSPSFSSTMAHQHQSLDRSCSERKKRGQSSSFLSCVLCKVTPLVGPLYGCGQGHVVCNSCQEKGGVLLSCPKCHDQDIGHRLNVAESLLKKEIEKNTLVECRYKVSGCELTVSKKKLFNHEQVCLFQTVKCPKALFSSGCSYYGPLCTIQEHGRNKHGLHQGVTEIERGVISSKMFDKNDVETCCSDKNNARFQPLELSLAENAIFYCYFERIAGRRLWFFFVRMYGSEDTANKYTASIGLGPANLDKQEREQATVKYTGKVAHYAMSKDEVRKGGLVLSVADEVILSFKKDNILFRIWFEVKEQTKITK